MEDARTKIYIIEPDEWELRRMSAIISEQENFCVCGTASDGETALAEIKQLRPSIVVSEVIVPGMDGMQTLSELRDDPTFDLGHGLDVVLVSYLYSYRTISRATKLGMSYYLAKPYLGKSLIACLNNLASKSDPNDLSVHRGTFGLGVGYPEDLEVHVIRELRRLGIPMHIKGFGFICYAVQEVIDNFAIVGSVTKELYPKVAKKFKTTPNRVERAIRHAIETAFLCPQNDYQNIMFPNHRKLKKYKPVNSEFIATLATLIRIERQQGESELYSSNTFKEVEAWQ